MDTPALEQFRWHLGSTLFAFFGASLFDQVALPGVSAAVARSGRFAENFFDRALRSISAEQLVLWAEEKHRVESAEALLHKHRDVHGTGVGEFAGVRYSALSPKLWNWIAMSGMFGYLNTFTACTGIELTPDEEEAAWQHMLDRFGILQLPSKAAAFPPTLSEARASYDAVVENDLAANDFLDQLTSGLTSIPLPTIGTSPVTRALVTPAWLLVRPMLGHVVKVCSFSVMHPGVRELTEVKIGRREQLEFAVYRFALRTMWRRLPKRFTLSPLAYHAYQHDRLVESYRSVQLDEFTPTDAPKGCPML